MRWQETEPDGHSDERLEQALERLGARIAPASPGENECENDVETDGENDFVSRVMQRIHGKAAEVRRPNPPARKGRDRRIIRIAISVAACLVLALAVWRIAVGRHAPTEVVSGERQDNKVSEGKIAPANPAVETSPLVRTSTWSTVTENVVLERDVPVRKLLYSEFERVELLDAQGNIESDMVFPTKAMLVASEERY